MAPALHTLTRRECEALLRSRDSGRIAVSTPQGPHIVPVSYGVVDDEHGPAVVARIGAYSVLGTYGGGAMLAFEVDGLEPVSGATWSVVARGRGQILHRPPEGGGSPGGQAWTSGPRSLFLRVRPAELSGRRLDAVKLA
jgi:hypothetical protein